MNSYSGVSDGVSPLNCSSPTVNCCLTNGVLPPSSLPDSPAAKLSFHDQCHPFSRVMCIFLGQFYVSLWELSSYTAYLVSGLGTRNPLHCRLNFTVMALVLLPIQELQQDPQLSLYIHDFSPCWGLLTTLYYWVSELHGSSITAISYTKAEGTDREVLFLLAALPCLYSLDFPEQSMGGQ